MSMFMHRLELRHDRDDLAPTMDRPEADSALNVAASSQDLTEAWRELLSRLPNDVYAALKAAMEGER